MKSKRLIVVLGMHRSGTSAIARGLKVLGVELGSGLLPGYPTINAKGFWEDSLITRFNDAVLNALGRTWDSPEPLPHDFFTRVKHNGFFVWALALLQRRLNAHDVFGFKDPRTALLLPFWKSVFAACDVRVGYVLAVRNPLSVSGSLARRNTLTFEKCATLWLLHCVAMLEGTEADSARVLVDYDLLISSPRDELLRVGCALDLEVLPSALDEYASEFLDPGLRHFENRPDDAGLGTFQGSLLRDFYGALHDVASGRMTLEDPRLAEQLQAAKRHLLRPPQALGDTVR